MSAPLRLIHFGDLHVWRFGLEADPYPKRFLGLANLLLRRARRFPRLVAVEVAARIAATEADWALFTGDLGTTALASEFTLAKEILAPVIRRFGPRLIAIPGNHDVYTPTVARQRRLQACLGDAFAASARLVMNDDWALVTADQCLPSLFSARGHFSEEAFAALEAALAVPDGRRAIVMAHYPVVYPEGKMERPGHDLPHGTRRRFEAMLEKHKVAAYLHGHVHKRWRIAGPGGVEHLDCGSAGMTGDNPARRPGFLVITLADGAVAGVEAHWLGKDGAWNAAPLEPVAARRDFQS